MPVWRYSIYTCVIKVLKEMSKPENSLPSPDINFFNISLINNEAINFRQFNLQLGVTDYHILAVPLLLLRDFHLSIQVKCEKFCLASDLRVLCGIRRQ